MGAADRLFIVDANHVDDYHDDSCDGRRECTIQRDARRIGRNAAVYVVDFVRDITFGNHAKFDRRTQWDPRVTGYV